MTVRIWCNWLPFYCNKAALPTNNVAVLINMLACFCFHIHEYRARNLAIRVQKQSIHYGYGEQTPSTVLML